MARITFIAGQARSLVNFRGPLIEMLLALGHSVSAIGPKADHDTLAWLSQRGVNYYPVPLERTSLNPLQDVNAFLAIRSVLLASRAEAIIAYSIKAVVYGLLSAKLAAVPHRFAMITGLGYAFTDGAASYKRRFISLIARLLYRLSLAHADAVIFQNPDDLKLFEYLRLVGHRNRTGIVNGSGVDIAHFSPVPLPNEPTCLMIARLIADKGIGEYISAARHIKSLRPETRFILVGPADPNPAALPPGLVDQAVADGVLEYWGEKSDVRGAIAASNIYVLPSYREGTPRSVLEAMAMGRPIVTTDAPGCRETVVPGTNGLLVPVRAVPELIDAIMYLIDRPEARESMGAAGRARAVSRYASTEVAKSIVDLLALQIPPAETESAR